MCSVTEVQTTDSPISTIEPDLREWRLVSEDDLSSQNKGFGSRDSETGPKSYNSVGEVVEMMRVLRSLFNRIGNCIETTISRINMDLEKLFPVSNTRHSENNGKQVIAE